jgi:2-deoxy-D-gluconate 3-dehydrogenase
MNVVDQFRLDRQLALVTGCKRGIGKSMAIALAEAGADIIGVSANLEKSGSEVENEIIKAGRKFYAYRYDLGKRSNLYELVDELNKDFPAIDILVNNAGTVLRKAAIDHPDEYWDEVVAVNQTAPFILTREIGKHMVKRGKGKIIFTASLMSFQGGINIPGYAASKGAIASMVKAFANEWAAKGVNVNAIAPGYIATDNTSALRADEKRNLAIMQRIPAGRWGEPDDFKGAVVFLASQAADYVHGTLLTVDGGWMGR